MLVQLHLELLSLTAIYGQGKCIYDRIACKKLYRYQVALGLKRDSVSTRYLAPPCYDDFAFSTSSLGKKLRCKMSTEVHS